MHFPKKIIGIMATTSKGVIGKDNQIPWNYPDELEHFRQKTKGHVIIMGRKTFDTLPSNLFIERTPLIFSQKYSLDHTGIKPLRCMEDFLHLAPSFYKQKIFLIGGARIAHLFLSANLISEFFLTKIHKPYSGDTCLDLKFFDGWREKIINSNSEYTIVKLQNLSKIRRAPYAD